MGDATAEILEPERVPGAVRNTSGAMGSTGGVRRIRIWGFLAALAAAFAGGSEVVAAGFLAPGDLTASRGPHEVQAKVVAYCVTSEPEPDGTGQGICADALPPEEAPRPRLAASAGDRVHVQLADRPGVHDDPRRISASIMRFRDNGRSGLLRPRLEPKPAGERAWTVRLPAGVRRGDAIYVFARFEPDGGDASYLVGLK